MGTKNNPGDYDCHAKAEPDEPMFTLLARDPLAADLVHLWAALRGADAPVAAHHFAILVETANDLNDGKPEKIADAMDCAEAMAGWRLERRVKAARGQN